MPDLADFRAEGLTKEWQSEIRVQEILDAFSVINYPISITEGDAGQPVMASDKATFIKGLVDTCTRNRVNLIVFKQWPFKRLTGQIYAEIKFMRRQHG